jgi:transgelin
MHPLNLPPHDVFLTVDLYEGKDPAQVLQCIGAFSRRVNAINPSAFPRAIGAKSKGGAMSPQLSGSNQSPYSKPLSGLETRARGTSNVSDTGSTTWNPLAKGSYSGRVSPTKTPSLATGGLASPGPVSSWSKKDDEDKTAPAWNIHQYGYMGGASQGNQGVSFGARRQITSAAPSVPSLAEKERRRKEEAERQRLEVEQADQRRREEIEAEEQRARLEEEQRWEEETRRLKEKERRQAEEEKRRWDEEQRRWNEEEESRLKEERELESQLVAERKRQRATNDARLNGQFLSQYQAGQKRQEPTMDDSARSNSESQRIRELERQLEEAKERERQYERERQERLQSGRVRQTDEEPLSVNQTTAQRPPQPDIEADWRDAERESLRKEWQSHQEAPLAQAPPQPPRPQPAEPAPLKVDTPPPQPPRPAAQLPPMRAQVQSNTPSRPLPNPTAYAPGANRTDRFLSSNPAPAPVHPVSHRPADYSTTTEVDLENQRRKESQAKTKAGGWASKSLLEREMERERERQREWEEGQKQTAQAARDPTQGLGPGQSWDVHQYGYMGGDSQNRAGPGLGVGGARRQIIGPRPLEGSKK